MMSDLEVRSHTDRPDFNREGKRLVAEGYAALYNVRSKVFPNGVVEVVKPTAFTKTLTEYDQVAYVDHDPSKYLGRRSAGSLELNSDDVGLAYRIAVPDTTVGRDFATLAETGDTAGVSFGFRTHRRSQSVDVDDDGTVVRSLVDVGLHHISPLVSHPAAYDGPSVQMALRSMAVTLGAPIDAFLDELDERPLADAVKHFRNLADGNTDDEGAGLLHAPRVRRRRR